MLENRGIFCFSYHYQSIKLITQDYKMRVTIKGLNPKFGQRLSRMKRPEKRKGFLVIQFTTKINIFQSNDDSTKLNEIKCLGHPIRV